MSCQNPNCYYCLVLGPSDSIDWLRRAQPAALPMAMAFAKLLSRLSRFRAECDKQDIAWCAEDMAEIFGGSLEREP